MPNSQNGFDDIPVITWLSPCATGRGTALAEYARQVIRGGYNCRSYDKRKMV